MTEKQKLAVKELKKTIMKRGFKTGLGNFLLLFALNVGNVIVNEMTVKSKDFLFFMAIASAILVSARLIKQMEKEQKFIQEEVAKIFDGKQ